MNQIRQGDVFLVRLDSEPQNIEPAPRDQRGLVLAEGETSGHHHALFGDGTKLFRYKNTGGLVARIGDAGAMMRVVGGGSGGVDRHAPVDVPPGIYEVRIQRHYWQGYSQQVED